jgi:excisionase family DNA binding protein
MLLSSTTEFDSLFEPPMKTNSNGNDIQTHKTRVGSHDAVFEPLLDSKEAAALLKIHPKTLQKMARNGKISAIHIGKLWRFRASALNEWLQKIAR